MSSSLAARKQAAAFSLGIKGMTCASCVTRVEKAISGAPGVASSSVNLATRRAEVVFSGAPDITAVVSAIGKAGYGTTIETARFDIDKMSCASCVNHAEKAFKSVAGVIEANVNLATKTGTVRFVSGATSPEALAKAVTAAGYPAHEIQARRLHRIRSPTNARRKPKVSFARSSWLCPDHARLRARDGRPYFSCRPQVRHVDGRDAGEPASSNSH